MPIPMVCGTCKHWIQAYDRIVTNGEIMQDASGHCPIHMCMCLKHENQPCCHGHQDWEGPVERCITLTERIVDMTPIRMPWQPGYKEWAEKHPDLDYKNRCIDCGNSLIKIDVPGPGYCYDCRAYRFGHDGAKRPVIQVHPQGVVRRWRTATPEEEKLGIKRVILALDIESLDVVGGKNDDCK